MNRTSRQQPNVLACVDGWAVVDLSGAVRIRIKEIFLQQNVAYSQAWRQDSFADVPCMKNAFNQIAEILFEARVLTVEIVELKLPDLLWDFGVAAGWIDSSVRYSHEGSRHARFSQLISLWRFKVEQAIVVPEEIRNAGTGHAGEITRQAIPAVAPVMSSQDATRLSEANVAVSEVMDLGVSKSSNEEETAHRETLTSSAVHQSPQRSGQAPEGNTAVPDEPVALVDECTDQDPRQLIARAQPQDCLINQLSLGARWRFYTSTR